MNVRHQTAAAFAAIALTTASATSAEESPDPSSAPSDGAGPAPSDASGAALEDEEMMRYPPSSVRLGLIAGGTAVLGIPYGLSAMSAALWPEVPGSKWLYVPIIGPWGALATNGCSPPEEPQLEEISCTAIFWVRNVLYVLDGIAQAGGAGIIGEGVFMTTEADAPAEPKASFLVVPSLSPSHTGLSIIGQF